ncbi:MAG: DUF2142 domain-containing protein [Acidimicrobiales bacterium]
MSPVIEHDRVTVDRGDRARRARFPARTPAWITLLTVSLLLLGASWAVSSPIGSSPDDDFHLASIWCSPPAPDDLCEPGTESLSEGQRSVIVPAPVGPRTGCFAFDATKSASCQIGIREGARSSSRANDGLYPGGYYVLMGPLAGNHPIVSALLMRVVAWILAVGLIAGAALVARPALRRTYLLSVLVTSVPLAIFLFASNNPSGLAIAGVGAFWCSALAFMQPSSRLRHQGAAVVGLAASALALSSRSDAGLYIAASAACVVVMERGWRAERRWKSVALAAPALVGVAMVLSSGQTSSTTDGSIALDLRGPWTSALWYNIVNLPALWTGSLGTRGLGWLDTRMPDVVSATMIAATGFLLLCSLVSWDRLKVIAVVVAAVPLTVVPLFVLNANHNLVGEFVQPRYLLPMIPVLLAVVLVPAGGRRGARLSAAQLKTIGTLLVIAHTTALHANIRRYVTGQDVLSPDLDANVEWWWDIGVIKPSHVWLVGSVAFAAVVYLCFTRCLMADPVRSSVPEPSRRHAAQVSGRPRSTVARAGA